MSGDGEGEPHRYTTQEIAAATKNFAKENSLGKQTFGSMYVGEVNGKKVTVLKLTPDPTRNSAERFLRDVEGLLMARHENILALIGYCPENRCLIYETLPGGNLEDMLVTPSGRAKLSQFDRLRIAKEMATGLLFLHYFEPTPIMHQDVKPGNIILDENKHSKLGGAGLPSFQPVNDSGIWGSVGYIDPVRLRTGRYLPQSDVYGLGLVVLQMLTCEKVNKVLDLVKFGLDGIIDNLDTNIVWKTELVKKVASLAIKCVAKSNRPDLENDILPELEEYLAEAEEFEVAQAKKPAQELENGLRAQQAARPVDTRPVDPTKAEFPQPAAWRDAPPASSSHSHHKSSGSEKGKSRFFSFLFGHK